MKKFLYTLILASFIFSCTNESEVNVEAFEITFSSEINQTKTDWKVGEIYHDTLEFVSFDDNYDYWYSIFKTKEGNTVSLVYDEIINSELEHGIFAIEWKIDSLPEAGEEGEMYFDERLISFNVIEKSEYFGDYLTRFVKAYSNDSNVFMKDYLNEKVGLHTTTTSGSYCVFNQRDLPSTQQFIDVDCKILEECLLGDFCDGYPNIENGFYFERVVYNDLPIYESPVDEHLEQYFFPLNTEYIDNDFKKVTVVVDEHQYAQLYFVRVDKKWYLWVEDLCNCSA